MGKAIFITGTGTGVGKTLVTAGLLRALRAAGLNATSMKPVQTGGMETSPDLAIHDRVAGASEADAADRLPYCFPLASSPHLAALAAGRRIEFAPIMAAARRLCDRHDAVLIEGAGGVLVPLSPNDMMLDLIRDAGAPAIVVAALGLGTINHTLLTLHALAGEGVPVLGVVFCETQPGEPEAILLDNPKVVNEISRTRVLGCIRHDPGFAAGDLAAWDRFDASMSGMDTILRYFRP